MYMAGRLRTASMPPSTLMESAVYSPSDLPLPFFAFFWATFSLGTSIGLLFAGAAAAADSESFGGILLHSNGDTSRCVAVAHTGLRKGSIHLLWQPLSTIKVNNLRVRQQALIIAQNTRSEEHTSELQSPM